jgi:hypothetical protein
LVPQLFVYLYLLAPVFVYFIQGVPPKESLEVITGVWREEGKLGANRNGLVAPKYFIDTEQGPREVHCGFPMQRRLCNLYFRVSPDSGHRISVRYDSYFGILAFEDLDLPQDKQAKAKMTYPEGVFFFARPKDTIYHNYSAHWMLFGLLVIYAFLVAACWGATEPVVEANDQPPG